ncbi:ribonuclease P protein component [candidate division KSB1 bacterium]|nr:ribonuclease P protein component [candidate division KSB1 bacterium]
MKPFALPKDAIIKSPVDFYKHYKGGKVFKGKLFILFIRKSPSHKIGFTVEKGIKSAVKRNRIKRKSREIWRLYARQYHPVSMIMLARESVFSASFIDLRNDFISIMTKVHFFYERKWYE